QRLSEQRVVGLPARERVAVVAGEEELVFLAQLDRQRHRRGEAAVERKGRALGDPGEAHDMPALLHVDDAVLDGRAVNRAMGDVLTVASDQSEGERYVQQALAGFRRSWRHGLLDLDDEFAFSRIVG